MNPYTKAAQFLIRLIGLGFLIIGAILLAGNLMLQFSDRPVDGHFTGEIVLLLIGLFILITSTRFAKWITRNLDDDE